MAAMFPAQVAALQVGSYFVGQYYILIQQDPSMVHRFYSDSSTMSRFDGARADSAVGMKQIHNLITRLNYTGVEIKSAHSVESWNGGILVMVSGSLQTKESVAMRKFAQTFFLAPQEKGYFVLNDIFQFIDDDQSHQHLAALSAQTGYEGTTVTTDPVTETAASDCTLKDETQTRSYISPVAMEQTKTVDIYSIPDPPQQASEPVKHNNTASQAVQDPPLTREEPVGEPAKHTYASILRVAKTQPGQSTLQNASLNKTTNESSDWQFSQQAYEQSQYNSNVQSEKSNVEVVDNAENEDEGESRSVYVGNLSSSITAAELEKEFKNFGKLRPEGIIIRSRKETGVFFAFIEFEDPAAVVNAIKASPLQLSGRLVHVEERKPSNSSYRGGRRGGRGRGSYQSNAPWGRYGNRAYGRGGGYENNNRDYGRGGGYENNRDYYSRPRGKVYHQRVSNQERGILGNHKQWVEQEQTE